MSIYVKRTAHFARLPNNHIHKKKFQLMSGIFSFKMTLLMFINIKVCKSLQSIKIPFFLKKKHALISISEQRKDYFKGR